MQKHRLKPDSYGRFHDSLEIRGFASYQDYLASVQWRQFNLWYRETAELPQACLACGSTDFVLHHWNYDHCGHEDLWDVVPLCSTHHHTLHAWLIKAGGQLRDIQGHLVECFGLSADAAIDAMRPFVAMRVRADRVKPLCTACGSRVPERNSRRLCEACGGVDTRKPPRPELPRVQCPGCLKLRKSDAMLSNGRCTVCRARVERKQQQLASRRRKQLA